MSYISRAASKSIRFFHKPFSSDCALGEASIWTVRGHPEPPPPHQFPRRAPLLPVAVEPGMAAAGGLPCSFPRAGHKGEVLGGGPGARCAGAGGWVEGSHSFSLSSPPLPLNSDENGALMSGRTRPTALGGEETDGGSLERRPAAGSGSWGGGGCGIEEDWNRVLAWG